MSEEFKDKFPERWMCPYCAQEAISEKRCMVDRDDIPMHLGHNHNWDTSKITWEYIFERLSAVGGV